MYVSLVQEDKAEKHRSVEPKAMPALLQAGHSDKSQQVNPMDSCKHCDVLNAEKVQYLVRMTHEVAKFSCS